LVEEKRENLFIFSKGALNGAQFTVMLLQTESEEGLVKVNRQSQFKDCLKTEQLCSLLSNWLQFKHFRQQQLLSLEPD